MAASLLTVPLLAHGQFFSDDFTRSTNSSSILPWQNQAGSWVITNGVFQGGPNGIDSYGFAYVTNSLTNCTISAQFSAATNAFGYGLGARVNPTNGAHYAAWIYPDNSPFTPNRLKLIKFPDWGTNAFTFLADVGIGTLGTSSHTITMLVDTNLISVYLDGALQISVSDSSSPLLTGGVSLDMYTYSATSYTMTVDNVSAAQINYPPTSANDLFTLSGDLPQTVGAPGVLYNDTDPDDTNLTAVLVSTTSNGIVSLASDGGFTYSRTNSAAYYDSFTYRATDGVSTSSVATVLLSLTSGGAFFADNFERATNPASLLPWTNHSGNWAITNGLLEGGTNDLVSYGTVFYEANWTNYAVEGSFLFPSDGYGGGIAGRVDSTTGQRYVAWLYPELSPRGPNHIRIAKFHSWDTYGLDGPSNGIAMATVALESTVVTNTWHSLKLAIQGNLLSVYYDGLWLTNAADFDSYTNPYPVGGMSVDFYSFTNNYIVHADNVAARPFVADDSYVTSEDTQLTVPGSGVLTNDTAMTAAGLTAILVAVPLHGSLSLDTNGGFTYTPVANFTGADSFAYEARDGTNSLGAAIVNLTVNPVNDPPQFPAQPDYFVEAGSILTITNTAVDMDVPGNNLSYALIGAPVGMAISTNGVITWMPTLAQSASTNVITTVVTDDGVPAMSDTNFINAIVTQPAGTYSLAAFFENFDGVTAPSLPAGWTTSQTNGQLVWSTQTSKRDSLPNGVFSSEPATNGVNELVTPAINLPAGEFQLRFRNSYDLESHPVTDDLAFDGGVLEIKIGAGAFTDILAAGGTFLDGGYTHTISTNFTNPLGGRRAWSGNSGGFISTVVALPAAASAQTIQLRWRCGTDNATSGNGWAIDDVAITNILCCNLSAPALAAQTNRTINELTQLTITNTATDGDLPGDTMSYSLSVTNLGDGSVVSGAGISAAGVITWTPGEAQGPSTNHFVTVVADQAGLTSTNFFEVIVSEVNVAPVFAGSPTNRTLNELTLLTVTNSASDSDLPAQGLSYTLSVTNLGDGSVVSGAGISAAGVITWTPGEAQGPSTNHFVTIVTDGVASATNTFDVAVSEVNVAPVFAGSPTNRTLNELTLLTVTNSASDSDLPAQGLSYTLSVTNLGDGSVVSGAGISAAGVITWTPGEAQGPSTNHFVTIVTDGVASATNTFDVAVSEVNVAPVFAGSPTNRTLNELTLLTVTNSASDSDLPAQGLSYTLSVTNLGDGSVVSGAGISAAGVITWTPGEAQGPSTNHFVTIVTDGVASATNTFDVAVSEVNVAPVFAGSPTNRTINELTLLTVTNSASDSDLPAQGLSYTLSVTNLGDGSVVSGAGISAAGVITWTPGEAQGPSTNHFVTIVTDGVASATNTFDVAVSEVNVAPVFAGSPTNRTLNELTLLTVTNSASDSDLPAQGLSYTLSVTNLGDGSVVSGAGISAAGVITWTPGEAQGRARTTL